VPEKFTQELMQEMYGKARYEYDCEAISKAICEPVWEILNRGAVCTDVCSTNFVFTKQQSNIGGKRWRPVLLLLTAEALGKTPADVFDFVSICEIVHNGWYQFFVFVLY
jgi:geranylgeranyl diphosphate synthase type I